ncbi:hypothetical protein NF212_12605 [Parasalinivibrio latis]|uniref:rhamnan synthesis F family protein n=1 Tax=Parasalinivibrio latis TaxID=2952610 RepID=UPI0030E12246
MKRLAIFAHYDRDNIVDAHVLFYLKSLSDFVDKLVFVSVSKLENLEILDGIVDHVVLRENVGYDFMSWQQGIESQSDINDYDELILCNDSCYGPLRSFENIFAEMSHKDTDVWGITDSVQISYHLQSYFLVFKRNVFLSACFKDFIKGIKQEINKFEVVEKYEVGLTKCLLDAGYKVGSLISYKDVISKLNRAEIYKDKIRRMFLLVKEKITHKKGAKEKIYAILELMGTYSNRLVDFSLSSNSNVKFVAWKELIFSGDPFIKVMLLRDNPSNLPDIHNWSNEIKKISDYDVNLISRHLSRVKND